MHKKSALFVALMVLSLLIFSAVPALSQEPTTFYGAWPYSLPPDGHFNSFASRALSMGNYQDLMEPPSAVYIWSTGEYEGFLASEFGFDADNNYLVTMRDGVTWSDGTPVTAQDLVVTYQVGRLLNWSEWAFIDRVEAVDDMTVKFTLNSPGYSVERSILVTAVRPASVYGDFGARAQALMDEGRANADDPDWAALLDELTNFRPETYVASGPYVLDPASISDASVTLVKNEGGLFADRVRFDQVVLWNGETEAVTPLVANGDVWYATHGFPPATEASFVEQGIDIIRGPFYNGPAIYVNHAIYPLNRVEVRQAIAYAIDREQNGFVSLGESGVAVEYMMGFSDNLAELWLSEETLASLNTYDYDPDAGAALLESIGFTKGDDGVWIDDQGNRLAFELTFPAEWTDWAAAAENAVAALNEFGFEITARGVQWQQQEQDVYDNNFQMAIRNWGVGNPFPGFSYLQPYNRYNGQGVLAGEATGGGMRFNMDVTYSGGQINVYDTALAANAGLDVEQQRVYVEQLAVSFNELLPCIPLWERYGNNPLNRQYLDAPPSDDPIWLNAGADFFMTYLIMTGGIGPAEM